MHIDNYIHTYIIIILLWKPIYKRLILVHTPPQNWLSNPNQRTQKKKKKMQFRHVLGPRLSSHRIGPSTLARTWPKAKIESIYSHFNHKSSMSLSNCNNIIFPFCSLLTLFLLCNDHSKT